MSAITRIPAAAVGLAAGAYAVHAATTANDEQPVPKQHWQDAGAGLGLFTAGMITAALASPALDAVRGPGPLATAGLLAGAALVLGGAGMFTVGTVRGVADAF